MDVKINKLFILTLPTHTHTHMPLYILYIHCLNVNIYICEFHFTFLLRHTGRQERLIKYQLRIELTC
jgi:hypothetical protein